MMIFELSLYVFAVLFPIALMMDFIMNNFDKWMGRPPTIIKSKYRKSGDRK